MDNDTKYSFRAIVSSIAVLFIAWLLLLIFGQIDKL